MALYSLKQISQIAANRRTYLAGVEAYNSGRVREAKKELWPPFAEFWAARVDGSDPQIAYRVQAGFDGRGELEHFQCTCPRFAREDGACKHVVALLVHKYYRDMVSGLKTAGELRAQGTPAARRTDDAARRMIGSYLADGAARLAAASAPQAEPVRLTPVLQVAGRRPELTFLLGGRRPYVIKDLARFYEDMRTGAVTEYGKLLRFAHRRENFAPESLPLLEFLLERCGDQVTWQGGGYGYAFRAGRELPLSPAAMDAFFELYAGRTVSWKDPEEGETRPLRFVDGDPDLQIRVTASQEKQGFDVLCPDIRSLDGSRHEYVRQGDALYRCTQETSERLRDFLHAVQEGRGALFISGKDIAEFCTGVLPAIRPFVQVEEKDGLLEQYIPLRPEAEVYLDAPLPGTVTAQVTLRYGEERLDPYADPAPEISARRDKLAELKVRLVLEKYFPRYLPEEGRLVLRGDDEEIFRLVTDGVADIAAVAALYATDRFRGIDILPPPRVAVGVRLSGSLLDLTFETEGIDISELAGVLESYRRNQRFHRLRSGRYVTLDDTALAGFTEIADALALTERELRTGRVSVQKYRAMVLDRVLRDNKSIQSQRDTSFKALVRGMNTASDSDFAVPQSLDGVLRNYQKTGYRWLRVMEQYGFGGILADDMGLGKTLQVIALLLAAREEGNDLPSLVVCPASLVLNWESEIRRFAPSLTVLTVLGGAGERETLIRRSIGYDVVVTSYDLLKRDIGQYKGRTFRYHILDEAQYIKNHTTQNARAVKAIDSRQRFALTGTPVENRLSELWSIFDFLMPGFLYTYARFSERFETPVVKAGDREALARLARMTAPFILRRVKQEVLRELPEKNESVLYADMTDEQRRLYRAGLLQARQELEQEIGRSGFEKSRMTVLAALTRLRQVCCDPALCYENYTGGSAKLESCVELLKEAAAGGHKVLLFSQFTSMLAIIEERLRREGLRFYTLQGSTPKERRAAMVEAFNADDTEVFLISLRAGGTGLNLTGADVVIHYDPWWNVAAQNQATDRAYRIGQRRSVQVYRLITRGTVEEKILLMQENKRDLAESVVQEGDSRIASMSQEELLSLLE